MPAIFSPVEIAAMQAAGVTPPVVTSQMLEYAHIRYALMFAGYAYSALTIWVLLESGISAKTRDAIQTLSKNKFIQIMLFYTAIVLILTVFRLPLSLYSGHYVEHAFGLSHQTLSGWLSDLLKGKLVDAVVGGFGFWLAFTIYDKFPNRWPLILWACLTPLIAAGIWVTPLVVDPLYNKFSPMPQNELRTSIGQLATKAGIGNAPVFVVDKSKQTNKVNAYVTGIGSSDRIVLWDNTIKKLPPDEILAIVAHEIGHYVLGHIIIGFLLSSGGLLIGLLLLQKFQPWLLKRVPRRWRIWSVTDPGMITALLLGGTIVSFFGLPVDAGISREIEHQADAYGLKLNGNGPAMAKAFVTLSKENLSDPDPPKFIQFWFYDHPSLRDRIDFSLGVKR